MAFKRLPQATGLPQKNHLPSGKALWLLRRVIADHHNRSPAEIHLPACLPAGRQVAQPFFLAVLYTGWARFGTLPYRAVLKRTGWSTPARCAAKRDRVEKTSAAERGDGALLARGVFAMDAIADKRAIATPLCRCVEGELCAADDRGHAVVATGLGHA